MKTYFVVDNIWDEPRISKIFVEKETDKTYTVHHSENLLGWQYIGKRVRKSGENVFPELSLALQYLIDRKEASIKRQEERLRELEKQLYKLAELKTKLNEKE